MNTNNELKNHILCEFKRNENFFGTLIEVRGVVNDVENVVKSFSIMIKQQINNTFLKNENKTYTYNEKNEIYQKNKVNTFFDEFILKLTIKQGKKTYSGNSDVHKTIFKDKNGNWICKPYIELTIQAENIIDAYYVFEFAISHELTHLFDMLQYSIKNNKSGYYNVIDKNKYRKIAQTKNDKFLPNNLRAIAYILYFLTRVERNAYIAQLKQELLAKKDKITNNKTAFETIKTTESYKQFEYMEEQITMIYSIKNENIQNELINALNSIMNKKFSTYNQLKKYFLGRWLKWKKAYLIQASKIAYDIYAMENQRFVNDTSETYPRIK